MKYALGLLWLGGYLASPAALAATTSLSPKQLVAEFLSEVRSGRAPERIGNYFADVVLAHQMNSEAPETIRHTPADYAAHVREFREQFGDYDLRVDELIAEGDRVYARYTQIGVHAGTIDGHPATGRPLRQIASAVYRVQQGRIVEYWIEVDRQGLTVQLDD
ncbi:MAG: ester cyclase [Lysobacterales bacterium]